MRTVGNSKLPFSSDTRVAAMPVSRFDSVTVAPGTTAPVLSLTVPTTLAVSNCAEADDARRRAQSNARQVLIDRGMFDTILTIDDGGMTASSISSNGRPR